jgi:hypothetical protein
MVFVSAAALTDVGVLVSLFRGRVDVRDEHIHDEDIQVESDYG